MKKTLLFLLTLFQTALFVAQNSASVELNIQNNTFFDGDIYRIKTDINGKILIGGNFNKFNLDLQNKLIRLNQDGTKDVSFNLTGVTITYLQDIFLLSDGKILLTGITSIGRIIRLNQDGSLDNSFDSSTTINLFPSKTVIQTDEKILFAYSNSILRLNQDGSIDNSFNIGNGFNGAIRDIKLQTDGKLIVGGLFTTFNNENNNKLIRLNTNGTKDYEFNIGLMGFDDYVSTIELQNDNKIILGGNFTLFNNSNQNRLIRLNTDGTKDNSFEIGTGLNDIVHDVVVTSDQKIIVGGRFTIFNEMNFNRIVALNQDGSIDNSFEIGEGFDDTVINLHIQSDNKILVGGSFSFYNNDSRFGLLRLQNNGTIDNSFGDNLSIGEKVKKIKVLNENKLLVASYTRFNNDNYHIRGRLTCLNENGTKDSNFIAGFFNNIINVVAVQSDGKILVGGVFTAYKNYNKNRIIRLNADGSIDPSFDIGIGFDGDVNDITIQSDGKILVGGNFTNYNGISQNRIIRLNQDGSKDFTFDILDGFNGKVNTICVQSNGKILVGGDFTMFNNLSQIRVIRLNQNGSNDISLNVGGRFNNVVNIIKVYYGNYNIIHFGGEFTSTNNTYSRHVCLFEFDGSLVPGAYFNSGMYNASVNTICKTSSGRFFIGGNFSQFYNVAENKIIGLNSVGQNDGNYDFGNGFDGSVNSIDVDNNGKIWIGGEFTTYNSATGRSAINNKTNLLRIIGESVLNNTNFFVDNFSLYPNPTQNILNFSLPETNTATAYEIYNLLGEKVSYGKLDSNSISVSDLANGVYIVKVITNEGILTSKFIKE